MNAFRSVRDGATSRLGARRRLRTLPTRLIRNDHLRAERLGRGRVHDRDRAAIETHADPNGEGQALARSLRLPARHVLIRSLQQVTRHGVPRIYRVYTDVTLRWECVHRFLCLVSGGHRRVTNSDAAGSITSCARCGAQRHARTDSVDSREARSHPNLATPAYSPRPTHGPEEIEPRNSRGRRRVSGGGASAAHALSVLRVPFLGAAPPVDPADVQPTESELPDES